MSSRMLYTLQMDLFEVEAVDMAQLKKVVVGHDGAGAGSGWFLDKIIIKAHPEASEKYVFPCGRWLDEGEDDGKIERSLKVKEGTMLILSIIRQPLDPD